MQLSVDVNTMGTGYKHKNRGQMETSAYSCDLGVMRATLLLTLLHQCMGLSHEGLLEGKCFTPRVDYNQLIDHAHTHPSASPRVSRRSVDAERMAIHVEYHQSVLGSTYNETIQPCYTCEVENGTGRLYDCRGPQANDTTSYGVQDVHYVLHVAALSDSCVGGILAFASPCYLRTGDYRPLIGFINMCPRWIDFFAQFDEDIFDIIIQHEIFHALGFSPALYAFFRDENGDPRTPVNETTGLPEINYELGVYQWSDAVIKEVTLDWDVRDGVFNRTVRLFVTPNLVREAREHFGCPTLEGVEIEDNMGQTGGTGLSHFEQRIMGGESMTGFISFLRIFSRLSLAFFEDTGWYSAIYDQADPFNYGKNLGCDFVTKSCKWWMDTKRSR
ncbi:leishmanolysin-like peptidase [Diadema setosum]|uniref:leishmanolysin-like peptidase n=1 Tax=Diadema setosum TaxID=31175 RepID=UPI003B3A21BF